MGAEGTGPKGMGPTAGAATVGVAAGEMFWKRARCTTTGLYIVMPLQQQGIGYSGQGHSQRNKCPPPHTLWPAMHAGRGYWWQCPQGIEQTGPPQAACSRGHLAPRHNPLRLPA